MNLNEELAEMGVEPVLTVVPPPPSPELAQFERCKAWLEAGLEYSPLTMVDVLRAIQNGAMFWPGKNAAMVTEISPYGDGKAISVLTAGGDMDELRQMALGVEALGRLNGCTVALIEGRKGWERAMKQDGYEFASVTLRKAI